MSGGDARRALTALEAAAGTVQAEGRAVIDLATLEQAVDTAAVRYDRDGDQHYDVISAFIKSIRGSDADAALHYLARMIEAGEDPRFIARRLVVHASEDIGLADPTALLAATAAAQAVQLIGMPEARINLAQATDPPRPGTQVERRRDRDRRRAGRRPGGPGAGPSRRRCATGTTPARPSSGTPSATAIRTTCPKVSSSSSTRPTSSSAGTTTSRRRAEPSGTWPSGWPSCAPSIRAEPATDPIGSIAT